MIVTRLAVRYKGGYFLVDDTTAQALHGVSTQLLTLGDIEDQGEARRIAEAQLATLAQPEREIDPAIDPFNPDAVGALPWLDFGLGDYITAPDRQASPTPYRVVGWAVSEDDTARVTIEPALNTLIDEAQIATQRWLRRMTPGALGGRSEAASLPVPADSIITRRALTSQATFSFSGPLLVGDVSSIWRPTDDGRMVAGLATLETRDPSADVVIRLFKQLGSGPSHTSSPVMDITIPAGETETPIIVDEDWAKTEGAKVSVHAAGDLAEGVTIQLTHLRWDS